MRNALRAIRDWFADRSEMSVESVTRMLNTGRRPDGTEIPADVLEHCRKMRRAFLTGKP